MANIEAEKEYMEKKHLLEVRNLDKAYENANDEHSLRMSILKLIKADLEKKITEGANAVTLDKNYDIISVLPFLNNEL